MVEEVAITILLRDRFFTPIGKVVRGVTNFDDSLAKVKSNLSGVTSQLVAFAAGFVGVQAIGRAIDRNKEFTEGLTRLQTTLLGSVGLLEEQEKTIERVNVATGVQRIELRGLASDLLNAGVPLSKLDDGLQAVVDTSAGLGVPFEAAAKAVGLFEAGLAGELGERIPELKVLSAEGRLAADGIQLLLDKFGGQAAAQAATTFGEINTNLERIDQTAIDVGESFAELKSQVIEDLADGLEGLSAFFENPAVRGFFQLVKSAVAPVLAIVAGVVGLGVGIVIFAKLQSAVTNIIGPIVKVVAGFVAVNAPLLIAVATVTVLSVKLLDLLGLLEPLQNAIGGIGGDIADIFSRLGSGEATIQDLLDFVTVKLRNLLRLIEAFLFSPFGAFFDGLYRTITGVVSLFKVAFIGAVSAVGNAINDVVVGGLRKAAAAVDAISLGATDFASKIPDRLFPEIEQDEAAVAAAIDNVANGFSDAFRDLKAAQTQTFLDIDAENQELQDRIELRNGQRIEQQAFEELQEERRKNAIILSEVEALQARIAAIRSGTGITSAFGIDPQQIPRLLEEAGPGVRDALASIFGAELKRQLEAGLDPAVFLDITRRIEQEFVAGQLEQQDELLAARRAELETLLQQASAQADTLEGEKERNKILAGAALLEREIFRAEEARARTAVELLAKQQEFRDLTREVAGLQVANVDAARARFETSTAATARLLEIGQIDLEEAVQRNLEAFRTLELAAQQSDIAITGLLSAEGFETELEGLRTAIRDGLSGVVQSLNLGLAEAIVEEAKEAREELDEGLARIRDSFQQGALFRFEAEEQEVALIQRFEAALQSVQERLAFIAASNPELAEGIAELGQELETLDEGLTTQADGSVKQFFVGFTEGAAQAGGALKSLGEVGLEIGQLFSTELGRGLVDVFVTGKQSLSAWGREFAVQMGLAIGKLLVLRGLQAALAAVPGGGVLSPIFSGIFGSAFDAGSQSAGGFAAGGIVPGPRGVRQDIMNIRAMPGEGIVNTPSTQYYGEDLIHALNARAIPRGEVRKMMQYAGSIQRKVNLGNFFQGGGVVEGVQSQPMERAVLVANEEAEERMQAASPNARFDWLRTNSDTVRGILGINTPGGR